jgi:dienelactone hydrolase
MFEYFPKNYPWNLAVNSALNAGGVIGEIDEICRPLVAISEDGIKAAPEWGRAWARLGARLESLGDTDSAAGHKRSASHKYRRASIYYLVAERNMHTGDPARMSIYRKALVMFRLGEQNMGDPVEFVDVPYKDDSLPALFVPAKNLKHGEKAPCMVHFDGLDVMKELIVLRGMANELSERGVSVLLCDHPGVGEALRLRNLKMFPELEVPAGACIDYLETRHDVDADRIGMIALSLGGYYAPRAAAFEKRFKCCVAWGAIWDYGKISMARATKVARTEFPVSDWADQMMWVFGKSSVKECLPITERMTLEGVIDKVTCPILITHGETDRQVPLQDAVNTFEGAINSPRRELRIFTAAEGGVEHCQADNVMNGMDYMSDWIVDVLINGNSFAPPKR